MCTVRVRHCTVSGMRTYSMYVVPVGHYKPNNEGGGGWRLQTSFADGVWKTLSTHRSQGLCLQYTAGGRGGGNIFRSQGLCLQYTAGGRGGGNIFCRKHHRILTLKAGLPKISAHQTVGYVKYRKFITPVAQQYHGIVEIEGPVPLTTQGTHYTGHSLHRALTTQGRLSGFVVLWYCT